MWAAREARILPRVPRIDAHATQKMNRRIGLL
jgi:hypothetical protein